MAACYLIHAAGLTTGFEETGRTPRKRSEGWDEIVVEGFYYAAAGITEEALCGLWEVGEALPGVNAWLEDIEADPWFDEIVWTVKLTYRGLLQDRTEIIEADAGTDEQEADEVTTPDGLFERVRVRTPTSRIVAHYVVVGSPPDRSDVGTEQPPPYGAGVHPANPWSGLTRFTYQFPNGWVLTDRKLKGAPGNPPPAWLVTDVFEYRFARVPGGKTDDE